MDYKTLIYINILSTILLNMHFGKGNFTIFEVYKFKK